MDLKQEWRNLLIDTAIAENHNWISSPNHGLKIQEIESIIVSGILIRAISLLDHAIEIYIDNNNFDLPAKNPKLFERLKALAAANLLIDYSEIDKWRKRRNDVGHKIDEHYKWTELRQCLLSVFKELNNLNILDSYPQLTATKTSQRVTPSKEGITIEIISTVIIHEVDDKQNIYYQFGWKITV